MYNGLIVLDKIYGAPSRACVNGVGAALGGRKQKTGHAGTLDTTASGTLIVLAGYATRLSEAVMNLPKTYEARVAFGWETSTDDASGEPLSEPETADYDEAALKSCLPAFCGVRLQTPPRVSAVTFNTAQTTSPQPHFLHRVVIIEQFVDLAGDRTGPDKLGGGA